MSWNTSLALMKYYILRVNISDTPPLIVAGYFLDEAYGDECCFTREKRRHLKTAVRLPPFSWFPRMRKWETEGRGVEDRCKLALSFLSTRVHPECCYKISCIFVMLYCMLTWLKTELSKFELISMHSISMLQVMITNIKMSRLKCD